MKNKFVFIFCIVLIVSVVLTSAQFSSDFERQEAQATISKQLNGIQPQPIAIQPRDISGNFYARDLLVRKLNGENGPRSRTEAEEIKLDKKMKDGLKVS